MSRLLQHRAPTFVPASQPPHPTHPPQSPTPAAQACRQEAAGGQGGGAGGTGGCTGRHRAAGGPQIRGGGPRGAQGGLTEYDWVRDGDWRAECVGCSSWGCCTATLCPALLANCCATVPHLKLIQSHFAPHPSLLQLEKKAKKGGRSEFGKSAKVFGMIQQHMDGTTAAARAQAAEAAAPRAAHLKL